LTWVNLLGLALGLAMDAFAVSIVAGLTLGSVTSRHTFRLAFHFGLFQAMMPVLGWLAGNQVDRYIAAYDHWVAFSLLCLVGGKMLLDARTKRPRGNRSDPTRGLMLVTLSVATSIDALAVGMSMAFMRVSVWVPAAVIGIVAATLTAAGIRFGNRLGARVGRAARALGGCVLLFIGLRIVVAHLAR
jgi:putative Mn2+ efflux pump MntP